jgi:hypothetical protein
MNSHPTKKQINSKKGGIADEIEKLRQRREDRKHKNGNEDKKQDKQTDVNGKQCDAEYENMMNKKKKLIYSEPEKVSNLFYPAHFL